jgi:predicted mannosyl-3-phosphoglycerate phosphatase (HAD superfamily)
LRRTPYVVYIAVDDLVPVRGKSIAGFDEFTAALEHHGIPNIWVTNRSRLHIDAPRREHAHTDPFIAEGGCVVCMPEDYFHLKPAKTLPLGRFTCIPVAELLPAAALALESLSEDTGVPTVTLKSLSPRELVQNTGLPLHDAEQMRRRDFDELFFFAGAADADERKFQAEAVARNLQLRQDGVLWSLAINADLRKCIQQITRLYDRALKYHAHILGIATSRNAATLFPACDRMILLTERNAAEPQGIAPTAQFPLHGVDTWEEIVEFITAKTEGLR